MDEHLMLVPCSRSDVFTTEAVGILEKRLLMKMLTAIVGYNEEEMNNELKGKCYVCNELGGVSEYTEVL